MDFISIIDKEFHFNSHPGTGWGQCRINVEQAQFAGTFWYHSHILEHEDGGTMGQFVVV
ncbi:MAG: hypothetical protein EXR84_02260 [Gammaproteobacteria bacterium]|nr:hypothetical protein [Gammaproteobacteria bacterium]